MIAPSFSHILRRTAEAFGVSEAVMRSDGMQGHAARLAYSYLASGLSGGGVVSISQRIGRSATFVIEARETAALLRETDAAFAALLWRVEIDVLAECGVADRFDYPLPRDFHAARVARELVSGDRSAMGVSLNAQAALGAAYLSLAAEAALLRTGNDPGAEVNAILAAARAFVTAQQRLDTALYTTTERDACRLRDAAFKSLSTLLGNSKTGDTHNGKIQPQQNSRREPARAANP